MSSKFFWKSLLATPALLGAAMIVSSSAIAAEAQHSADVDSLLNEVASASSLGTPSVSAMSPGTAAVNVVATSAVPSSPTSAEAAPVRISTVPVQAGTASLPAIETASVQVAPKVETATPAVAPAAVPTQIAQAAPTQAAPSLPIQRLLIQRLTLLPWIKSLSTAMVLSRCPR